MPTHIVAQGDCTGSIADAYGFSWETVWNHPKNEALRAKRKEPNVLFPGDEIFVPEVQIRKESRPTGKRHKFVKKVAEAKLSLRLLDNDQPRANVPYTLVVDGKTIAGVTDGDGFVKQVIPSGAQHGRLSVGAGTTKEIYEFQFGTVDPIETEEGVRGRLVNLGFAADNLADAISAFQLKEELSITGEADAATRARLQDRFGQ
jgi:hypothetical protein